MRSLRMQTSVIFLLTLCSLNVVSGRLSPKQSLVWGSGLRPEFVMPVRFFFIQAVDEQGQNFTESAGEDAFQVAMYQNDGARARVWSQVLDRHDGSYIARFKMMQSYRDMKIEVLHNGKPVAQSPYVLEGMSYHEKCYCPVASLDEWLDTMQCRQNYDQIDNDLAAFPDNIDMVAVTEEAVARFNQRGAHSLCHFVIKDNQVYRQTHGQHVGFKMFMDSVLLSMTRKMRLPDMEFIVNLGDWPLVLKKKQGGEKPIPIFSWCGSDESFDIIMPTYDVTESTLETMGRCDNDTDREVIDSLEMPTYEADDTKLQSACRVSLDLLSVQANTGPKWENKSSLAFWRGRDSRRERLDLVKLSRKHPDIIDAKLTNMFFFKHEEDLGEIVKHVSFFDFFKHKYQINLDGTVAAYRTPYLMAGTSVVLKQESPYYEHFYKELEPYKHYIPIKRDISDVLEKIQWAKDHDDEAKQIALNAQEYIRNNLMADDVFCYHAVLFREFTKKVISKPEVREGMELVEQPSEHPPCYCERLKRKDEL